MSFNYFHYLKFIMLIMILMTIFFFNIDEMIDEMNLLKIYLVI